MCNFTWEFWVKFVAGDAGVLVLTEETDLEGLANGLY